MADTSRHDMTFAAEVDYGVVPTTPNTFQIRHTGTTLALAKDTSVSEELRADRQISCFRHGARQVGGDISFEMSADNYDIELEATLCGTWEVDAGGVGIDELKAGVERRSFTIIRNFTDITAAEDEPWHYYLGSEFNTFTLVVSPEAIVTGTFGVMGQDMELNIAGIPGSIPDTPTSNCPFTGFSGVVKEGGVEIGIITEITLTLENGLAVRPVIGDDKTLEPTIGRSNVTGQMTAYFEDSVLLRKFLDETPSSIEFILSDGVRQYTFKLPNIKYTGGQADVAGEGSIMIPMPFQGLYDPTEESNIVIIRQDAV